MALIELCLLSLVSAQEPNLTVPPTQGIAVTAPAPVATAPAQDPIPARPAPSVAATPQGPPPQASEPQSPEPQSPEGSPADARQQDPGQQDPHHQDPRKALQDAELAGESADPKLLAELAMGADAKVAARAAWLLGKSKDANHVAELPQIATESPHPEARLQALQAIRVRGDVRSTELAIRALADDDRRVRTVAVQLLGKLRRPAAIDPLLDLITTSSKLESTEPATDIQAALLTLSDLDASQHLLRMSIAINDGNAVSTGEALTYTFQTLSPKLATEAETTVLVAVLDHKEPMLRRYAITRLTERNSKTALNALEGRLGKEGNELRPLIEVAIAQLRHAGKEAPKDEIQRAKENAKALVARATIWWRGLAPTQQALVGSSPIALIVLLWLARRAARRRHHDEDAVAAAALVQPSDDYLDEHDEEYDEYEDGEEYEEQGEFVDGEFEEGFDEDGEEQGEYDTAGWDEGGDETVPADATPEDELFR